VNLERCPAFRPGSREVHSLDDWHQRFILSLILTESSWEVNELQYPTEESLEVFPLWVGEVDGMV